MSIKSSGLIIKYMISQTHKSRANCNTAYEVVIISVKRRKRACVSNTGQIINEPI
jgi:hypothetical protein